MSSYIGGQLGPGRAAAALATGGVTTYAMASLNAGWSARFMADSTDDILSVKVNWSSVASAGQITIRVETDDTTAGKPSGALYDANAVMTGQTPTAGVQTFTFSSPPTTGLTVGSFYHVVILTTTGGTTQTLSSYNAYNTPGPVPTTVLTAADGTTRSNFAVVANSSPCMVLLTENSRTVSIELQCNPFITTTNNNIFTTNAAAAKIVTTGTINMTAYSIDNIQIVGTPAGDLRIRLFNSSDAVVSGTTVTVDKDVIVSNRSVVVPIGPAVSLTAGTYRIVLDSSGSANSSNCFRLFSCNAIDANAVPNCTLSTTADVTATPPTWSDTSTAAVPVGIVITSISAAGGGLAANPAGGFVR